MKEEDLNWCEECNAWHKAGVLTVCMLRKAKDQLLGTEKDKSKIIAPKKPWKEIED
jgi:hypothetical protein